MSTPGRRQTYERDRLRVTYDPSVCTHAALCVGGLPSVFRPQERRWIQLEHSDDESIMAAVARCPSGALQAVRLEPESASVGSTAATTSERASDATVVESVEITLSHGGPLLVAGPVVIKQADGSVIARQSKAALCRCGHTGNAPFCDGSHNRVGFSPTR